MAIRSVGTGLGIKPIRLSDPLSPDSEFDSTIRMPIKSTAGVRPPSLAAPMAPRIGPAFGSLPAPQPQSQVPVPAPSPITTPMPTTPTVPTPAPAGLPGYDPSQLNFEGSTFNPQTSATTAGQSLDQGETDRLLNELQAFSGLVAPKDWRTMAPDQLLANLKAGIEHAKQYGVTSSQGTNRPDSSFRQRLDDWLTRFTGAIKPTSTPNTDYQTQYLGQKIFNSAMERLKMQGASDAQQQDEEVLALLASRGLLNSGIAARELTRLNQTRMQNLYDAANRLNEMLLSNELGRLTQRDLATLQADLAKRNQEAYLRLQQKLQADSQPNSVLQTIGTIGGAALPFLLSAKKPDSNGVPIVDDRKSNLGYRNA